MEVDRVTAAQPPVFVVGPSRSGTGLMMTVLRKHPLVHVSRETHYFDDLRPKLNDRHGSALGEQDARRCEDYFLALAHRPYGRGGDPEQSPIPRAELRAAAEQAGGGADGYFEAFCRLQAAMQDKERWGEKTPRHVFRIAEMLDVYPQARVICMVRDPRSVVTSYRFKADKEDPDKTRDADMRAAMHRARKRTRQSNDLLVTSLLWRSSTRAAMGARERFGADRVHLQRFEDLVVQPEASVRKLANWLGLEFSSSMLEVPLRNSSFSRGPRQAGFSREAIARWRHVLSDGEVSLIQSVCGQLMERHGYDREPVRAPWAVSALYWLRLPVAVWRSTTANRARAGRLAPYVWRRVRLAVSR